MRTACQEQVAWPICVGVLLACLGTALIAFGEWHSLDFSAGWLIYLAGFTVLLGGFFLIWKDPFSAPTFQEEPKPKLGPPEPEGVYLGSFDLNGYSFKAYECETAKGGRQFRLISSPSVTPEREAAFIRYIVNEGLVENIWQGMSQKIEEEANWAFFQY